MAISRDPNSKAVISTDLEALNKYKIERSYYRKVERMQQDLVEIKRSIITIYERIEKLENN
jgi:hypothetical protein